MNSDNGASTHRRRRANERRSPDSQNITVAPQPNTAPLACRAAARVPWTVARRPMAKNRPEAWRRIRSRPVANESVSMGRRSPGSVWLDAIETNSTR